METKFISDGCWFTIIITGDSHLVEYIKVVDAEGELVGTAIMDHNLEMIEMHDDLEIIEGEVCSYHNYKNAHELGEWIAGTHWQ